MALIAVCFGHAGLIAILASSLDAQQRRASAVSQQPLRVFFIEPPRQIQPSSVRQAAVRRQSDTNRKPRPLPPTKISKEPAATAPTAVPPIDWQAQLRKGAQAALAEEEKRNKQLSALSARRQVPESMRPPQAAAKDNFRWSYRANRVEKMPDGTLIVWISERCVLIGGLLPFCAIGKMPPSKGVTREEIQEYLRRRQSDPLP